MAKKSSNPRAKDEPVNIIIDPALVAEMQAENAKSPEQRAKERDEFMRTFFSMGADMMKGMMPPDPNQKPAEQKPKKPEPEFPDPLEF